MALSTTNATMFYRMALSTTNTTMIYSTNMSNLTGNISVANLTTKPPRVYAKAGPVEIFFLLCLMIVIILGNSLVYLAFSTVDRKLRTITNYFVINLAVSDILVGTFSMSFWLCLRTGTIQYSETAGKVYAAFDILCGAASILNLTFISVERTFAVKFPAKHRNVSRSRTIIHGGIASVWVISVILAFLFSYALYFVTDNKVLILTLTIIIFIIPTIVIICSYISIFHAVKTRDNFHQTFKREVRLAAMIGIVIVLFLLCWFPFFLFNLMAEFCSCWNDTWASLIPAVKYLHYTNSTMNPLIYAYRNSDYRRAFKKLLYKVFTCGRYGRYVTSRERALSARSTYASQGAQSNYRETLFESKESGHEEKNGNDYSNGLIEGAKVKNGNSHLGERYHH